MSRSRRCRYGERCRYLQSGSCRFYHPPTHSSRSNQARSRSRSRDRTNNTNNSNSVPRVNLEPKTECVKRLQFMTYGDGKEWGKIKMKETSNGIVMTACSHFPTRMGRCRLMSGKYYYEVHLISPCNARIGWSAPNQLVHDENFNKTGENLQIWAFSGWNPNKPQQTTGTLFLFGAEKNYGINWSLGTSSIGTLTVVSTAVDMERETTRYYSNGVDWGEVQTKNLLKRSGIAPSISIANGSSLIIVTDPRKFKYQMPKGYSAIDTGFKMKWSYVLNKISLKMGGVAHDFCTMIKDKLNENIDGESIEEIISELPIPMDEQMKQTLKSLVQNEFDFMPDIEPTTGLVKAKAILIQNGFNNDIIQRVIAEFETEKKYNESEGILNEMISKCVKYENEEARKLHLKNWKKWNCLEVIEWIETISNGHFKDDKYEIFKQYYKSNTSKRSRSIHSAKHQRTGSHSK